MSRDANGSTGKVGMKAFFNVAGFSTYAIQC